MLKLSDREWRACFLSDIFTISPGKRLIKADMKQGTIPFIGATDSNNGITNWVNSTNASYDKNVLGVNYNGSVVENFFHGYNCIFSDDVKRLHLKNYEDNKYVMLFLKTMILQQKVKYTYGYKFNENRMVRQKILVPINCKKEPDYSFMQEYVKERETQLLRKYIGFAKKNITITEELNGFDSLQWGAFRVLDLFNYRRGNQNNMYSLEEGKEALISAKNSSNGLKGFYSSCNEKKELYRGNCITLNNDGDGGVGLAYYQPYDFLLDTHVYALYPQGIMSKCTMLFIALSISQQRDCFSHGYSISQERLSKMKIMLPVDKTGNPNYKYMDQYILTLISGKYEQYMKYSDE